MLKLRSKWRYGVCVGRSVASDGHVIGIRFGCFLVRGVRRMPPSARHQVQVLLSMRGTPACLAHGGPAEPRSVVEPPPPIAKPSGSRDVGAGLPTRVEEAVLQTRRPHEQHQTVQRTKQHQVPVPSCRAVERLPNDLLIPPSKGRFQCPKSRDQAMPGTVEYTDGCPGGEMVAITTHNTNVELPAEQPVHLTWEVQHLVWEVPFQFKHQVTLPVQQQAHQQFMRELRTKKRS